MTGRVWSGKTISGSLLETTGRWGFSVRSLLAAASGGFLTAEIGRIAFEERDTWRASRDRTLRSSVNMIGASGHPALNPVKGYNGSISWGLLFKPHGRLKLTLLAICIDLATL